MLTNKNIPHPKKILSFFRSTVKLLCVGENIIEVETSEDAEDTVQDAIEKQEDNL